MAVRVERCKRVDPRWVALRGELWPQTSIAEHSQDASIENHVSHAVHRAVGFEETERVIFFRKRISVNVARPQAKA